MSHVQNVKVLDIGDDAYHADPCPTPSLSSSIAKVLLDKSPGHAHQRHPRLGAGKRTESKTFDAGRLAHKLLLGKGAEVVEVEAKDWRTKKAQEERDAAYADGKIPALSEDLREAEIADKVIRARLGDMGIDLVGDSEVVLMWQEEVPGLPTIWARGMLDHLVYGEARRPSVIYDLKTSVSAHPRACSAHVVEYGYDIQRAAYVGAVDALLGFTGRVDFVHIFAEIKAPYAVTVGRLDGVLRERGERRWRSACEQWAECMAFGKWPLYTDRPITIEAPPWALAQMQETDA